VCLVLGAATAFADEGRVTVRLKDGKRVEGRLLGFGERSFRVEVDGRVEEIREGDVLRIEFVPEVAAEPSVAVTPASSEIKPVHAPPQELEVTTEVPGRLQLDWASSYEDEFVLPARYEIWQQLRGGDWVRVAVRDAVSISHWEQPVTDTTPRRFKVVSLARVDGDHPVVQRLGLTLATEDRRRESDPTDWVTPLLGFEVRPVTIVDPTRAYVRVRKWVQAAEAWVSHGFVARVGEPIGRVAGQHDYATGWTFVSARTEERHGPAGTRWVQVLVTADAQGTTREWTDEEVGADSTQARLRLVPAPERSPTQQIRAALADRERRIDVNFPAGTRWGEALDVLREVTGLNVVPGRWVALDVPVQVTLRQARLAEALQLLFELGDFTPTPYCEALYLTADSGPAPTWLPSRAAVDSEQGRRLQGLVATVDWSELPFEEAVELLGAVSGLNVVLTSRALEQIQEESAEVTLRLEGVQLINLLTLTVRGQEALAWTVRHGAVVIHLEDEAEGWAATDDEDGYGRIVPHAQEGDVREEVAELNRQIAFDANDAKLYIRRGRLLLRMRQHGEALRDFERAIELKPGSVDALLGRSLCRRAQGDLVAALRDLREAEALDPSRKAVLQGVAIVLTELGRSGEADQAIGRLVSVAGDDGEVWVSVAQLRMAHGDHSKAGAALARARDLLGAEHVELLATQGALCVETQRFDEALAAFSAALEQDPRCHQARVGRAYVLQASGRLVEALEDFQEAILIDPDDADGWLGRGAGRLVMRATEEALQDLTRASELEPERVDVWIALGSAHTQAGDGTAALKAFDAAIARDPSQPRIYMERAALWVQAGEFERAEQDVARVLELDPGRTVWAEGLRTKIYHGRRER
jgi:tetratricopeptide (TPR) repeat protein